MGRLIPEQPTDAVREPPEDATPSDPVADSLIGFLHAAGADRLPHGRGRTLLEHLLETYAIACRWKQPAWLAHAALIHSIYSTEAYNEQLLAPARRQEVIAIAGQRAERLAYLFCVTPRGPLLAGTHLWAPAVVAKPSETDDEPRPTRDELDALVLLHMANVAEQSQAENGSPGRWLVRLREISELLLESDRVKLPLFIAELAAFSEADESLTRSAYRSALARGADPEHKASRLALAAATCPVIADPCVWLAELSWRRGDRSAVKSWAARAQSRLSALGVAWDKRLTFDQWWTLTESLTQAVNDRLPAPPREPGTDPRELFEAVVIRAAAESHAVRAVAKRQLAATPDAVSGSSRFQRYVESFGETDEGVPGRIYPDLEGEPWYDPRDFPLARYLEAHFSEIRQEILALEPSRFQRESERIRRSGSWDVIFLYERGRRRHEVCDRCPVTTRGIEAHPAVRTLAGLIYVSRMRGSTRIHAHRGPTNLRVRCHLAVKVPHGDCAIRVGADTRRWEEGRCLVFNDYFEHEAWNLSGEDRIVLIADIWHPSLSATEVKLLEGLHGYAHAQASKLNSYWSANDAASRAASEE